MLLNFPKLFSPSLGERMLNPWEIEPLVEEQQTKCNAVVVFICLLNIVCFQFNFELVMKFWEIFVKLHEMH